MVILRIGLECVLQLLNVMYVLFTECGSLFQHQFYVMTNADNSDKPRCCDNRY